MTTKMITDMVSQCFETLNIYGKTTEELPTIIKLFQVTLAEYQPQDIEKAFAEHIKTNSIMPVPADIVARIDAILKTRRELYEDKVRYSPAPTPPPNPNAVSWGFKVWSDFDDADKQGLAAHLLTLSEDQLKRYKLFLMHHCKVPRAVLYE